MKRLLSLLAGLMAAFGSVQASSLDGIRQALEQSSVSQVQEKVYIHTDNQCYFVGDTLWYKAYVVRADNLQPTDMSRILYVELLSPDGLLVERQQIIVAPEGYTCGQFALKDSLYSGYYELRAYTRWMLNFNVSEHMYTVQETWRFFSRQMCADYYRLWDGLYSRVLPIYSKPENPGDYDARRMYQRPKTRLQKPKKEELFVTFYPEGGSLVEGLRSRVAFAVENQLGEAVSIKGTLTDGNRPLGTIATTHLGRGVFTVTPGAMRPKALFTWHGKQYTFTLPKAEKSGAVVTLDGHRLTITGRHLPQDREYGLSVLCRGSLRHFQAVGPLADGVAVSVELPADSLPVGVNDVTVFDSEGGILADRLFFNGGMGRLSSTNAIGLISPISPMKPTTTYEPYEPVSIGVELTPNTTFSLSVRDTGTDEPTYNDGNLMTDLLLSSELRGFIAKPAYYFEKDDEQHRSHLDLLMMVQGWRKYKWQELSDTARHMRYEPEQTMTVSGEVYKMVSIPEVEQDEVTSWQNGVGMVGIKNKDGSGDDENPWAETEEGDGTEMVGNNAYDAPAAEEVSAIEFGDITTANDAVGINHSTLKRDVLVEAELLMGDEIVAGRQKTRNGRFLFEIPPFYGATYLNLKAYKEKDSLSKSMLSRSDATVFREDAYADYFVKRDMPYPMFTHKYSYYENHAPEWEVTIDEDSLSELSMENDVHQLQNVNVSGHRRGRRAVDWQKPAFVRDAYDLYNDLTDYGLSFGKFDMRQFPLQVAKFLLGNMGRPVHFNVDGRLNGQTYWRNYDATGNMDAAMAEVTRAAEKTRAAAAVYNNLKLSRLQDIRVFTDYEPRNEDSTMVVSQYIADATVEMVPIADDGKQVVYRDRHIYLHGMSEPAEFYQPDYSHRPVGEAPADYRRTLYWNPNARSDGEGRFTANFYNNGKETRIKISAAGVTPDGRLLFSK
jgi:hypothetical protein